VKVAVGSDHRGYALKEKIKKCLEDLGHSWMDMGAESTQSVDWPDLGVKVAESVASGECDRGIAICGSGIGMSMVSNKVPGIRAGLCHNAANVRKAREDTDINILTIGADFCAKDLALEMVKTFLSIDFTRKKRHIRRLKKLKAIEEKYLK
jgi:ribose 5-phosphate isomerase B